MPQQKPQNWQRWLDILGIIFAGGIETAKVLLPPVGIPIEIVKQLYVIYERDHKQLRKLPKKADNQK